MAKTGWSWFDPATPDRRDADLLARQCARTFSGADGIAVLEHLKAMTTGRCLGPDATDATLRTLEGQRALVSHILSLIERGRDAA